MSNLIFWNFNLFAFSAVVANSCNTSSLWCEYRIDHCTEFITGQTFLVSFPSYGILYRRHRNSILSLVISDYFHKTTNQHWIENSKMTGLKDCKIFLENVSLSLAKRKLTEWMEMEVSRKKMNGSFLISQLRSCMLPYTPKIAFLVIVFRVWFYDSFILTSVVLKISETSHEHTYGGVLC